MTKASGLNDEPLRILVIGNSLHHTKSLVFLIRELGRLDPTVQATLVCYAAQRETFAPVVAGSNIRLVAFEGEVPADAEAAAPPSFEVTVSRTGFLRKVLRLKQLLTRLPAALPAFKRPLKAMIAGARQSTPGLIFRERALVARLKQEKLMAERLFDQVAPNLVLAFGDRHPDIEAPILLTARERGVKVVIPYTSYSGKDIMVEVRKDDLDCQATKPFSFYRLAKAARYRDQLHQQLFYQPPHLLAAYESFGALSRYPWCLGNGLSDVVCVDSEVTAQRYQKDKVPPHKIRITGDVIYDKVHEVYIRRHEIKAALLQKYGFDPSRKLIVVALPQLAEQGVMAWEPHWKEMRFLVEQITKTGQNLLLSLHPRMNPADYAFLEREYPCRIAHERLSEFVSAPDIFIANYSSTVVWAILCGIKCIVVDFYGLNYKFFDYLQSVSIVRERERLPSTLAAAIQDSSADFSADWKALSRQLLDGRTIERYLDLFRELANASTGRKSVPEMFPQAI